MTWKNYIFGNINQDIAESISHESHEIVPITSWVSIFQKVDDFFWLELIYLEICVGFHSKPQHASNMFIRDIQIVLDGTTKSGWKDNKSDLVHTSD